MGRLAECDEYGGKLKMGGAISVAPPMFIPPRGKLIISMRFDRPDAFLAATAARGR